MQRFLRAGCFAALVLFAPLTTAAQGVIEMEGERMGDEKARAHFDFGRTFYGAGRFREAAEEWEKAYALSNRPELLYNIYVAYRDASETAKARDALERYLASDIVPADQRINLEARLEALRRAESSEAAAEPAPAPAAETPAPAPVAEPAPPPPAPAPASAPAAEPSILPYVLVGVGGALVAGGIATGLVANGKVSDIEKACGPDDVCPSDYPLDDERADARLFVTLTDVLIVGGVVTAGVGAALWLFADDGEAAGGAPAARLGCAPGGCIATFSGSF